MDDLKTILETLSEDDRKELAAFIQRQKKKKHRKDLELFQLLQQPRHHSPEQLIKRLYPEAPNPVAYYALRKRLARHLTDFILLKRMEEDSTAAASIMGLFSLARYLFDARVDRLAWTYLLKAEKLAVANEQFDLLNTIYNLQIEKADNEFADDLEEIIRKRNQNKQAADEDERANIANSLINQRLRAVRRQGRDLNFDKIIQEVLQTYNLTEAVSKRPSLLYKLMSIARSAVLARKDFLTFEPYVLSQYHETEQKYGFIKAHQYYKLSLLYMIAHVFYRNKKFGESIRYLAQLHDDLSKEGKSHYATFYPRYIFLMVANLVFLRCNDEAIALMEKLLYKTSITLSTKDQLTAQLGLSFNYFAQGSFSKANRVLLSIKRSDKWLESKMGREWVLKKNMGELILQYELGNEDLVLNKIRAFERTFRDLLQEPAYRNVRQYLQLIKHMVDQPFAVESPAFFNQVESTLEFETFEQTDIQAMSFYAWLKAKMLRKPYYQVLLELARSDGSLKQD
ncbi:hypothetical protein H9Q13_04795 [Pontibacter sp. JH31]|uniref:Uncharacterized protein n=1 Tax=Pontibacter aquaedesilientis TaxID=2766980 RepID=A0ABR7XDU9_9BACT|nr:hypothetical protein [Pontibacter aquaedesilientis]MBD1396473.1 hypothetical protein [Pontibacter aquaedesilientis]